MSRVLEPVTTRASATRRPQAAYALGAPSLTAEVVCLSRALEHARPPDERRLVDPFAARFLRPPLALAARAARLGLRPPPLASGALHNFVVARHRVMDDALAAALVAGAEQVVILGAGYDARAHRFVAELTGRPVWEVDAPPTQARKRRVVARHEDLARADVRYVPVDFGHEDFAERLVAAGFPVGARTFFVWEGVSMYLPPAAVRATLDALARLGGPGSRVTADFWAPPGGPTAWRHAVALGAQAFRVIGEPLRFSLPAEVAPSYFEASGFDLVDLRDRRGLEAVFEPHRRWVFPTLYVAVAEAR